ncbi:hypothetical protein LXL04_018241 [Taraxacum kok-saghyz]
MHKALSRFHSPMNTASSAKKKSINRPLSTALLTARLRPSITRVKRKGDIGSPCLNPLSILNSGVGDPLTRTDIALDEKQAFIHPLQISPKFIASIISSRCDAYVLRHMLTDSINLRIFFLCSHIQYTPEEGIIDVPVTSPVWSVGVDDSYVIQGRSPNAPVKVGQSCRKVGRKNTSSPEKNADISSDVIADVISDVIISSNFQKIAVWPLNF